MFFCVFIIVVVFIRCHFVLVFIVIIFLNRLDLVCCCCCFMFIIVIVSSDVIVHGSLGGSGREDDTKRVIVAFLSLFVELLLSYCYFPRWTRQRGC